MNHRNNIYEIKPFELDEELFEEIQEGAILFFKNKEHDDLMEGVVKYMQRTYPGIAGKTVSICKRENEYTVRIKPHNLHSTKPIEEILCDVLKK